jgi:hypothetical protein
MPAKRKKLVTTIINFYKNWNKTHFYILLIFTLIGFFLRVEPIIYDTVHFSYDQGDDLVEVRTLLIDRKLSLIGRASGMQGIFMGPLWTWILAIPYILSRGSPSANVVFFAIIGTIAIWFTYLIVKRMTSKDTALITAFYVTFAGAFVSSSHIVLSPSPLTILMIFYIWFLWEIVERKKKYFFPFIGLLLGIFFQFEIAFALFMLPAALLIIIIFNKLELLKTRQALIGVLIFFLTFLPQLLFEFRHDFLMSKSLVNYFSGKNISLGREELKFSERLVSRGSSLWEDFSSVIGLLENKLSMVMIVMFPALIGWISIIKAKNKRAMRIALMLILITLSLYGGLSFYGGPVWSWYRAGMPIVFILLISLGWSELFEKRLTWRITALLIGVYLVMIGIIPRTHTAQVNSGAASGPATMKAQKQAIDLVVSESGIEKYDLYIYTPPVYTYVWDHMLIWYAEPRYKNLPVDYGYQRNPSAANNFFLIIEPDYFPTRIDGWKGHFSSSGMPISEWKLRSGIVVEKWQAREVK